MPYHLSAEANFSAAHTLPDGGDCARVHGHNWRVRVTVRVADDALDDAGMGIDLRDLERFTHQSVADFDHAFLNELPAFRERPTSAEHISRVVFERMAEHIERHSTVRVSEVEVWEMPQYRVVYRPE